MDRETRCCRRKARYNAVSALREFARIASAGGWQPGLHVYTCEICGGLHLGHYRPARASANHEQFLRRPSILRLITKLP